MSDPLRDVLELASREGALQGEGLEAFAEALRERARLVLAERVQSLEDRLKALEAEVSWRRESMASLEAEVSWRRESMEALEESVRGLGEELRRAQGAHAALLVHQRELVERVAAELLSVAALSPLRIREARRRLRDLAALLRVDSR